MTAQAQQQQANEPVAKTISLVLRAVRKHWPIIVACVLVAGGLSLVYSKSLTRIYQSSSMVELDPNVVRPMSEKMDAIMPLGTGNLFDNREYYETQYKIITSTKVLEAAARSVALQNDAQFFGPGAAGNHSVEQAAALLRGRVSIEPVRNSRLVLIKVDDPVPVRAKKLCDAVTAAYIDQNLEKAITSTSDSVVWLAGQVENVKKELEGSENALHEFKKTNDLASTSINESSNMVRLEMQDLSSALTRTRTRKQEVAARLAELSKVSPDSPDALPASELLNNAFLQELRQSYQEASRIKKALLGEGKGENHPAVRGAEARIDEARSALVAEIKNIQGALERDLAAVTREEAGEATLYEDAHRRGVDLTMKEIEYRRLDRSREQNERLYGMLLEHMKEADLARMMRVNNIHLIESATLPAAPVFPKPRTNVAIGLFVGLLLGFALAWLRESMDNTLKTAEDVERLLAIPFLGMLPLNAVEQVGAPNKKRRRLRTRLPETEAPELIVHARPLSAVAEAARSIRTNLMFASADHPLRTLLVTSSAPSEGKTTVACNVAIALAQSGQRVCIVDCDLRRPRLHRIFDCAGDAGVTNVLVGASTIPDVAHKTQVDNLYCIGSGPIPPNPADLLHSERFRAFIRELQARFDRIVIDSPPLVAVTDSAIISTLVDGTVFVLRAFSTNLELARQGLRTLSDVDAKVAGAILNAVDFSTDNYTYRNYYYYKRTGYGEAAANRDDAEPPQQTAS